MFCEVRGRERDGFRERMRAEAGLVEYFDSPEEGGLAICQVPKATVVRKRLRRHTRVDVYRELANRGRVGCDSSKFLAHSITGTPRYAEARSAYLRGSTEQRGAVCGIQSPCSSSVQLNTHQIKALRAVLNDPSQHDAMVDEVRLDKPRTIADHFYR